MNTKNLGVSALVGLLTLALWYNFLLKPARSDASKVKDETAAERVKLQPLQAQVAQANADKAHAAAVRARLALLQHAIPETPELANFIRDANGVAAASGIDWLSVTHGEPVVGTDGTASIAVGMQIKGTYEQTVDYLTRVAKLSRLLVIDNVQITAAAGGTAAPGGAVDTSGQSTGPFSGASSLNVTITARMFESAQVVPDATAAATAGATTATPAG
jgi:Tfp pilus assembly protein PilO